MQLSDYTKPRQSPPITIILTFTLLAIPERITRLSIPQYALMYCIEKVESSLREKLQHCILEEMKNHFKLMEDNMKRMEQMIKVSRDEELGVSGGASPGLC